VPVIPTIRRSRQKDHELEATLVHIAGPCLKKKKVFFSESRERHLVPNSSLFFQGILTGSYKKTFQASRDTDFSAVENALSIGKLCLSQLREMKHIWMCSH
jgi:hypothetical protein